MRPSVLLAALLLSTSAQAALVVNQARNFVSGTNMGFAQVADDFTLAANTQVTGLGFYTLQQTAADYSGSIHWAIYQDAAGVPGGVVAAGDVAAQAVATGVVAAFGYAEYRFDLALSAVDLAAGAYWLALQDGALGDSTAREILWESADPTGAPALYRDFSLGAHPDWLDAGQDMAFQIFGNGVAPPPPPPNPAPEPGTLALLAASLIGLRLRRHNA